MIFAMETTSWQNNINQVIYDDTSITVGNNGVIKDSDANGHEESRLTSFTTGKTYQVAMYFDFSGNGGNTTHYAVDEYGLTEFDRFERWYEFEHKKGTVPFWFPSITKQSTDVLDKNQKSNGMTLYKITGGYNAVKSGLDMKVSMTFEEVYSGIIQIKAADKIGTVESFYADDTRALIVYSTPPLLTPIYDKVAIVYKEGESIIKVPINKVVLTEKQLAITFTNPLAGTYPYKEYTLYFAYPYYAGIDLDGCPSVTIRVGA